MFFTILSKKYLIRFTSMISLGVAFMLVCIKFSAWLKTYSIALLTSVVDSLIDVLASMVTLVGICYAQKPADQDHRFGHGKAEAMAAFMQALLLVTAAVILGIESMNRLITPQKTVEKDFGIIIIIFSIILIGIMITIQSIVIKYTQSTAIIADRIHYITDVAVNITVLISLLLERMFCWIKTDASLALAISLYMIWNTKNIIQSAMLQLLDQELNLDYRKKIINTVLNCTGVEGIHDLRTRNSGDRVFIELHIEVNGKLTVYTGHIICNRAEISVKNLFPAADVSVHIEPTGIIDDRLDDIIR